MLSLKRNLDKTELPFSMGRNRFAALYLKRWDENCEVGSSMAEDPKSLREEPTPFMCP
jgi:hypothetical protein